MAILVQSRRRRSPRYSGVHPTSANHPYPVAHAWRWRVGKRKGRLRPIADAEWTWDHSCTDATKSKGETDLGAERSMIKSTLVIISVALFASSGVAADKPTNLLVFEFPDGVRGGSGQIRGIGKLSAEGMRKHGNGFLGVELLRRCGAKNARYPEYQVTHRWYMIAKSTKKDRDIVACVMKNTPFRFSVWVGSLGSADTAKDETPFREFWESPQTGRFGP